MTTEKPTHSEIGASSYYRWKACPGSVRLSRGIKSPESDYARQGTIAHKYASDLLEYYFFKKEPEAHMQRGYEDYDAIMTYVDFVKQAALGAGAKVAKGHVLIECKFDLTSVHPGLYGTADAVIYDEKFKKIYVIDYKNGAGILVDVKNNEQLMYYALGALINSSLPCEDVELVVVQPRCDASEGVIRHWSFKSLDLIDFAADLANDARKTLDPKAPVIPGEHCRFCPAAPTACPVLREKSLAVAKSEFSPVQTYSPEKLKESLDAIDAIEAWIKQVREFAYNESLKGNVVPGYKLVEKRATRKWRSTEELTVENLQLYLSDEQIFDKPTLKSPAQIEKLLSRETKKILEPLVIKESSGLKLIPESEPGEPASNSALTEFKKIEPTKEP